MEEYTLDEIMAMPSAPVQGVEEFSIDEIMAMPEKKLPGETLSAGKEEGWGEYLSGLLASAKQGIPFSDEISGAGAALSKYPTNAAIWFTNLVSGEDIPYVDRSLEQGYEKGKEEALLPAQVFQENHPIDSLVAQLAGGSVLPVPEMKAKTVLGGALEGGKTAAGYGLLYGAGTGEGLEERAANAAKGAVLSAPFGAALGAISGRAAGVTERAGQQELAETVAKEDFARTIAESLADQSQVEMAQAGLAQLAEESANKALGGIRNAPSSFIAGKEARNLAQSSREALIQERKEAADLLFAEAREVPTPQFIETIPVNTGQTGRTGMPVFEPEMKVVSGSQELENLLTEPIVQVAIRDAKRFNRELRDLPDTHPAVIQKALSSLSKDIADKFSVNPSKRMSLGELKSAIEAEVSQFNPQLIEARTDFAARSAPIKELDKSFFGDLLRMKDPGKASSYLLTKDPETIIATKQLFADAGSLESFDRLIKAGFSKLISRKSDSTNPLKTLMGTKAMREKVRAALTEEEFALLEEAYRLSQLKDASVHIDKIRVPKEEISVAEKAPGKAFDFFMHFVPSPIKALVGYVKGGEEIVAPFLSRNTLALEKGLGQLGGSVQEDRPSLPDFAPEIVQAKRIGIDMPKQKEGEIVSLDGYSVDDILDGLRQVESGGGKYLKSSAGALGPYQFMPATWEEWGQGGDVMSEEDSREAAKRYLLWLYEKTGSLDKALQAYNFGIGNIQKGKALPQETKAYVPKIMAAIAALKGEA